MSLVEDSGECILNATGCVQSAGPRVFKGEE